MCELLDGTILTPREVAALLDEALIERLVFDTPSRVTDISQQRLFTGALRHAIQVRDRTCTHRCCDYPAARSDVDHIVPFEMGGPTTEANGRVRCPFHNRHRHQPEPA